MTSLDSFNSRKTLNVGRKGYVYYSLPAAEKHGLSGISRLPMAMKVLLENCCATRTAGRSSRRPRGRRRLAEDPKLDPGDRLPARAGADAGLHRGAAVVDLAAMRDAMSMLGGDPKKINPLVPVDLVIDHSVMVDFFGNPSAFKRNVEEEYKRNQERYRFLKWAQQSFEISAWCRPARAFAIKSISNIWPDGVHRPARRAAELAYPDTLVGTDSPHHHGERTRCSGLGRGRDRSRGGDARPAALDGDARGDRL